MMRIIHGKGTGKTERLKSILADDDEVAKMAELDGRTSDASLGAGRRARFIGFRRRQC